MVLISPNLTAYRVGLGEQVMVIDHFNDKRPLVF